MPRFQPIVLAFMFTSLCCSAPATDAARTSKRDKTTSTKSSASRTAKSWLPDHIEGVVLRKDVAYLEPHRAEKLDVYLPADRPATGLSPAVLMIHGGGWVGGVKDAKREVQTGTALARAGYVAVSVEYMKEKGKRWPTNLFDCKNAVRWIRKNAEELGVDPERIGVIGGSAGGHLALMVAFTTGIEELEPKTPYPGISSHVLACVNLYGIADVARRQGTDKDGTPDGVFRVRTALFDENVKQAPEKWALASPVNHVDANDPPTLTIHGTADTTVDRDQAIALDAKMKAAGASHTLMLIPDAPHAFLLQDKRIAKDIRPTVLEFFDEHLKVTGAKAAESADANMNLQP